MSLSAPTPQSSRSRRRLMEVTTSHERHNVSRTSRRLTGVNVSQRSRRLTEVTTSHGRHDISWRSRRLTDVVASHRRHDVSRRSRRLTEVTTSHGGHDVSRTSRRLTEVTTSRTSHGGHDVCTALSLSAPASQSSRATFRCSDQNYMIKAVCLLALSCPYRRQPHRAVGSPSGARVETT